MVTAGFMCAPLEGPKICAKTAILRPKDRLICVMLGAAFHVSVTPQLIKTNNNVAMNSAKTPRQNSKDFISMFSAVTSCRAAFV